MRDSPSEARPAASPESDAARAAGLIYVSDSDPGIHRLRDCDGFKYMIGPRQPLHDERELKRIAKLAIPPAYEDVWICRNPRGHLQATGRDARGRKQYRYHPAWRTLRDEHKFERMVDFALALPGLRRKVRRDLSLPGLPADKVVATVVSLLDLTLIRVGNEQYARANKSFGLTTLRSRHARLLSNGRLSLSFRGKSGTEHDVTVQDRKLVGVVARCHQLPGQHLFQYLDEEGGRHPVTSDDVNDYLRRAMDKDFTAKDFRTWVGTMRAVTLMARTPLPDPASEHALNACILAVVRQVASELRNTPAVCRKAYINPKVFERWRDGTLGAAVSGKSMRRPDKLTLQLLNS
jgi:DNA topoisomerase IB